MFLSMEASVNLTVLQQMVSVVLDVMKKTGAIAKSDQFCHSLQKIDCFRTKCSCQLLFVASFKKRETVVFLFFFVVVVQNVLSSHMTCSSMIANDSELSQHQK